MPENAGFPMAWWLTWFVVASLAYGLLAIWFWRAARRHDLSKDQSVRSGESR
jgi:cytochrome oxidase assembly protein ShyY1